MTQKLPSLTNFTSKIPFTAVDELSSQQNVAYYNQARPHQGIQQQIPDWYDQDYPLTTGPIIATPVLNGLHHDYSRAAYLH